MPHFRLRRAFIWFLLKAVTAGAALAFFLAARMPHPLRACVYGAFRELARYQALISTREMLSLKGEHFEVRYCPADEPYARLVLETAERFYGPVSEFFSFTPPGPVPVIIHPTRSSLNAAFGWPDGENAVGVYWAGVIRVLSPREWVDSRDEGEVRERFVESGPVAHELAHLAVDYMSRGNVPRWLNEGIAQYVDYRLTGFRFAQGEPSRPPYGLEEMDRNFDLLEDQVLAYRQSLAAVEYLVEVYGEESLHKILAALGRGEDIDTALRHAVGESLEEFSQNVAAYCAAGFWRQELRARAEN